MGKGSSILRGHCECWYTPEVIQRRLQPTQCVGNLGGIRLWELDLFAMGNFVGGK